MNFDAIIERRNTHSMKWDMMEARYGVPTEDGIPMWVADMDFRAPDCIQNALKQMLDHGVYGYFGDDRAYLEAVGWWLQTRHGWTIRPEWVFTTHGLVNGTALCLQAFTEPGDGVVLFTPVYHAFARVILAAGRKVVEVPLVDTDGRMVMDFPQTLPEGTRMAILCSPHNPGGQVWSADELRAVAAFARQHGLVLVSDEVHNDLVMPGHRHVMTALAAPEIADLLVTMTATTKTFNIAGSHTGNVIIADEGLRARFAQVMIANGIGPNSFGIEMARAAYSPEGAEWVDALCLYLDGNRQLFEAGMAAIPGLKVTPLQATYLEWVDFRGTGMDTAELLRRIEGQARIAVNHGDTFGAGGQGFMRFNIATPRSRVVDAVERMQRAFADLQ